uniref:Si:dkey-23k10.2 n=1 Tax=Sinocyclocheilus rhinocerous TaxID=307959 RepID=A0A673IWQ1_9TELE
MNSTKLKTKLRKKFQHLHEGIAKQGNSTLLNEIYTELYITEGENGETDSSSKREETEDTPINSSDIFKTLPGQDRPIRTVLTKGVAGIGKTVSVQKFILDWAEGKANQDIHLIFPLPFRELNLLKDQTFSLQDLLQLFMGTKQLEISPNEGKIIFIFDGLDECRLGLDFHNNVRLCDVTESASVDVLLTDLIGGNLLPPALIWITSRPVRGFNDPQKEEYFRKRFKDQSLADRIISHLKSSRSLYIMCHIPVFCWISATVLEKMLSQAESGEIPKTLTQMFTHFLIIQTNIKHEKDYEKKVNSEDMILKLGKLAFQQLIEGNLTFYEEDLRECGIDVIEASVYSGLWTCREDLHQRKVYSFVHLTIQEYLAALYVHHSFTKNNINVFNVTEPTYETKNEQILIFDLHQKAVDEPVNCKTGHLDLFLRFLLGFSLESNQTLLEGLLTQTESRFRGICCFHNLEETVNYIKKKIEEHPTPEKFINLFHCLNDLGYYSLIEQMLWYLKTKSLTNALFSLQWSALIFVLLTSENVGVFQFKNFGHIKTWIHQLKNLQCKGLSPSVISCAHFCCTLLNSVLTSKSSQLRELDLSENKLGGSGLKLLCDALLSPHCKLEKLTLRFCGLYIDAGCDVLASALNSNPHLKTLDMTGNNLRDSRIKLLSTILKNPCSKLETLCHSMAVKDSSLCFPCGLHDCGITDEGCAALASALRSNPSHLRELDLSHNNIGDSGRKLFSLALDSPHCKLEILRLIDCGLTDEDCADLALALSFDNSCLRELNLSENKFGDSGIKHLCSKMKNPHSKLEALW